MLDPVRKDPPPPCSFARECWDDNESAWLVRQANGFIEVSVPWTELCRPLEVGTVLRCAPLRV